MNVDKLIELETKTLISFGVLHNSIQLKLWIKKAAIIKFKNKIIHRYMYKESDGS
jgi:hypothetical protein